MKITNVYRSQFLRATDLRKGERPVFVIQSAESREFAKNERTLTKVVLVPKKGTELRPGVPMPKLALNKTNALAAIAVCGSDDTDEWTGHSLILKRVPVEYQGRMVLGIRLDLTEEQQVIYDALLESEAESLSAAYTDEESGVEE